MAEEITVQPRRASWLTLLAGLLIAATGIYFLWFDIGWAWVSVVQLGVGGWMVADGAGHLRRHSKYRR